MSESLLSVSDVSAFYGNVQVLWDISMSVDEGRIVSLIGANAGGKSTLVNCITGLHANKTGSIKFKGTEISKCSANEIVEMGITQVPEGRKLFPVMTVEENLEMGAYNKRAWVDKDKTFKTVYEIFPILEERKKQLASSLSGGEQQMCAIARGMVSEPTIIIIDELSLGLAPKIVTGLFQVIKKIAAQGMTVVLIEQDTKNSLKTSDYTYVIETGRLVMEGESMSLLNDERLKKAYLGM